MNRRAFLQGVLSLAALGPLARVAVAEEVERVESPPNSLVALINEFPIDADQRMIQAGPRIEETLYRCSDGEFRTLSEMTGGRYFKGTWVDAPA